MVMPFTEESDPKCYECHASFATIEALRAHQEKEHGARPGTARGPAPGDVSVF